MIEEWGRSVEQILLAAEESKARVIGVVSPEGKSGVTTLCQHLADAALRAGSRPLLADFAKPVIAGGKSGWGPGHGALQAIQSKPDSYDVLEARPTAQSRPLFNSVNTLRHMFDDELRVYDRIVIDLPAAMHPGQEFLNPVAAARAADIVILVCVPGRNKQASVKSTVDMLEAAGVKLAGVVLNDVSNAQLGTKLAQNTHKLSRWSPRFAKWLERKILQNDFLKTQI